MAFSISTREKKDKKIPGKNWGYQNFYLNRLILLGALLSRGGFLFCFLERSINDFAQPFKGWFAAK